MKTPVVFTGAAAFFFFQPPGWACSVCFGNPNSLQTKGAMAGVLFLFGVIVFVLCGAAYTFIQWGIKERELEDRKEWRVAGDA